MRQKVQTRKKAPDGRKGRSGGASRLLSSPWASLPVVALSLILHALHLAQMHRYPHFQLAILDADFFDQWARRIAGGDWLGRSAFFVDPLYAYFLAGLYRILGFQMDTVRIVQALLGALSAVVIHRTALRVVSPWTALAAGLLAAGYRPFIYYDGLLLKEALSVLLVALFLLAMIPVLEKGGALSGLVAGFLLGLATLTRGNLLLVAAFTVPFLMLNRNVKGGAASGILFLAGLALAIAPVTIRNYVVGHELVVTTTGMGANLYIGNHPDNHTGGYVGAPFERPNPRYEEGDFADEAARRVGHRLSPGALSSYWTGETLKVIAESPWRWIGLTGKKFWLLTHADEVPDNYSFEFEKRYSWVLRLPLPAFGLVLALAVAGAVAAFRDRKRTALRYIALFAGITLASLLTFFVTSRFRIPAVPALIVVAAFGVESIARGLVRGPRREGLLLLLLAAGFWFYDSQRTGSPEWSDIHFNFGTAYAERGLLKEAAGEFEAAVRIDPDYAEGWNNLGDVMEKEGKTDEALRDYERALAVRPGYWEARLNRARLLLRLGRVAEASPLLEMLAAERGDSYEPTLLLGMARRRQGDNAAALDLYRKAARLDPDAVEAPYNEAMLLEEMGQTGEAREILAALAKRHPEHQPTRDALQKLKER